VDGVAIRDGDRILAKDQAAHNNGIWVVNIAGGWIRATDADTWDEHVNAVVWVEEGETNRNTGWRCTVAPGGTLGTTAIAWTKFSTGAPLTTPKLSVRLVATTSLGSGSQPSGAQTIDGIAVANGDRVLVTAQSDSFNNGIWVASTAGLWTRTTDADTWAELVGALVFVDGGVTQKGSVWRCDAPVSGTLGTTVALWTKVASPTSDTGWVNMAKVSGVATTGVPQYRVIDGRFLEVQFPGGVVTLAAVLNVAANGGITDIVWSGIPAQYRIAGASVYFPVTIVTGFLGVVNNSGDVRIVMGDARNAAYTAASGTAIAGRSHLMMIG
jgi:hypothetical protein